MKQRTLGKIYSIVDWFGQRLTTRAAILMYHRVVDVDLDPWGLCVTPEHFAQHLAILQQFCQPISLQQLTQAHREGKIPQRAVAITFDDGYVDNLLNAKPLLEQYQIPATVFVTTGKVGQNREFWWDDLERVLLSPGKLPEKLHLSLGCQWELGKAASYSEAERKRDHTLKAWEGQPGSRLAFYYSVWNKLRPLSVTETEPLLAEIIAWAGADSQPRPNCRPLNHTELKELAQGNTIEIGAHTVNHPFLSAHSPDYQRQEIEQSKRDLETMLERSITSFAYPFGDYNQDTIPLVEAIGFNCACSTVQKPLWKGSDRFQFPRLEVVNCNGDTFKQNLLYWFGDQ
jgi:peptidoglycan/xylan/chitin deacetylase (PgdA/CDA1 family)